ncbi:MAG: hypothetical protein AAGA97_01115 [Pseudomonadota bacterium]
MSSVSQLPGLSDRSLSLVIDPSFDASSLTRAVATVCLKLGAIHQELAMSVIAHSTASRFGQYCPSSIPVFWGNDREMTELVKTSIVQTEIEVICCSRYPIVNRNHQNERKGDTRSAFIGKEIECIGLYGPYLQITDLTNSLRMFSEI